MTHGSPRSVTARRASPSAAAALHRRDRPIAVACQRRVDGAPDHACQVGYEQPESGAGKARIAPGPECLIRRVDNAAAGKALVFQAQRVRQRNRSRGADWLRWCRFDQASRSQLLAKRRGVLPGQAVAEGLQTCP